MSYLQLKKRAFMKVVNSVKGIVRTASGIPPLMLEGCVDNDSMIGYTIHGDNTGDYDEASGKYKIPVICRGKNLWDIKTLYPNYLNDNNGLTYTNADFGTIGSYWIPLDISKKYTWSFDYDVKTNGLHNTIAIGLYNTDKNLLTTRSIGNITDDTIGRFSTTYSGASYFRLVYGSSANACDVTLTNMQFEEGDTATDFEPYVKPVTTNIYLDEPLRSGETVSYPDAPKLPTVKGTTIYEVDTTVQPSQMDVAYYSTEKGD